jgi:hypothetical protein
MHSPSVVASIDAMFNVTGLLIRAAIYGVFGGLLSHTDSGMMILAGLFVGDALASAIHIFWDETGHTAETIAELILLAIVFFWLGSDLQWPRIFASSSILFWTTAAGVTALRLQRGMLKPVGLNDNWS